jgi:hypothetical protein
VPTALYTYFLAYRWLIPYFSYIEAKAKKELQDKAKGKGPLNTGQQGIKKSGKK